MEKYYNNCEVIPFSKYFWWLGVCVWVVIRRTSGIVRKSTVTTEAITPTSSLDYVPKLGDAFRDNRKSEHSKHSAVKFSSSIEGPRGKIEIKTWLMPRKGAMKACIQQEWVRPLFSPGGRQTQSAKRGDKKEKSMIFVSGAPLIPLQQSYYNAPYCFCSRIETKNVPSMYMTIPSEEQNGVLLLWPLLSWNILYASLLFSVIPIGWSIWLTWLLG